MNIEELLLGRSSSDSLILISFKTTNEKKLSTVITPKEGKSKV